MFCHVPGTNGFFGNKAKKKQPVQPSIIIIARPFIIGSRPQAVRPANDDQRRDEESEIGVGANPFRFHLHEAAAC